MQNIFTIDVEDWFHILDIDNAPTCEAWDSLPSRVEPFFQKILSLLEENQTTATCFFLAWVAKKHPHLVHKTIRAGHEVASHGFWHKLIYEQDAKIFLKDIQDARSCLEDISENKVRGYRAPGFSVTQATPFFLTVCQKPVTPLIVLFSLQREVTAGLKSKTFFLMQFE